MNLIILTWCLMIASSISTEVRYEGILYNHSPIGLRAGYPGRPLQNYGYPNMAPHHLVQTWRITAFEKPGQRSALKVTCQGIIIPRLPNSNDCGNITMTLKDGGEFVRNYCGPHMSFVYLSKTNDILYELRTGERAGGIVDCLVQAVPVNGDGSEITTTTTPKPKPSNFPYLNIESEEVDSSEDGGEEGDKTTTCPCGWANKAHSRIVNGSVTERSEFPFTAALVRRGTRGTMCGATIITSYHVLTAAHCTQDPPHQLSLIVGIYNINDWSVPEYPIEKIINHEGYRLDIVKHDISLIIMRWDIRFNQFVGPACLPPRYPKLQLDRKYIKIIGWGRVGQTLPSSDLLRKVNVRVVPIEECNRRLSYVSSDNQTQICTYSDNKSACMGDSGGPVVWLDPETNRYTHVGIASFVIKCADYFPAVHTNVQSYLHWIQHHIKASGKLDARTCNRID